MIHIVGLLEYPVISLYAGQAFATRGTRVDWPLEQLTSGRLNSEISTFYQSLLKNPSTGEVFVKDPSGRLALREETPAGVMVIGSLPPQLQKFDKFKPKAFLKKSDAIARVIAEGASGFLVRQAIVHGVVNYNARILGASEAYQNGDKPEKYLKDIQKACHQISSLIEAARVFSPDWIPDLSRNPLNSFHQSVLLQINIWADDLNTRGIYVQLAECRKQVHMDPGLLQAVFANIFSNIVKYAKLKTSASVSFSPLPNEMFGVIFKMHSRTIRPDEVERIKLLGERGVGVTQPGDGVGLALITQVLRRYGGDLIIKPGTPSQDMPGFSENEFILAFRASSVR